jgi:hypothetical protein
LRSSQLLVTFLSGRQSFYLPSASFRMQKVSPPFSNSQPQFYTRREEAVKTTIRRCPASRSVLERSIGSLHIVVPCFWRSSWWCGCVGLAQVEFSSSLACVALGGYSCSLREPTRGSPVSLSFAEECCGVCVWSLTKVVAFFFSNLAFLAIRDNLARLALGRQLE